MAPALAPFSSHLNHGNDRSDSTDQLISGDQGVNVLSSRGHRVSTCFGPTSNSILNGDDDYKFKKLSSQVEMEHLRSMQQEFERVHLLHTKSVRNSVSVPTSGISYSYL